MGDVIFDVGANIGSTSKIYMKLYRNIKIIAFEPLPIFKIKSNQIKLIQKACGDHNGVTKFYICAHQASSSLTLPNANSKYLKLKAKLLKKETINLYEQIQVPIVTIDKVVNDDSIETIFLLKIDVEGSELKVLHGAAESLKSKKIKNIQIEIHHNDFRENYKKEIFDLLLEYDYLHQNSLKHYFGNFTEEFFILNRPN